MSQLLKAAPVAASVYERVTKAVALCRVQSGHVPTLATVLIGDDPASHIYVRKKQEMCEKLGLGHRDYKFAADISQSALVNTIRQLNADNEIDGILVQAPLPKHLNAAMVYDLIDKDKDVDCFSAHNVGRLVQGRGKLLPCTPAGAMEILRYSGFDPAGKTALVVGRSDIVGKPMAMLLLHANATVTIAHSKTPNLADCVAAADIVVAAIGKPNALGGSLPWKSSAIVLDVGINRLPNGKVVGDVDFAAVSPKVAAITPVPGGIGPMTIAMLMVNTTTTALVRKNINNG